MQGQFRYEKQMMSVDSFRILSSAVPSYTVPRVTNLVQSAFGNLDCCSVEKIGMNSHRMSATKFYGMQVLALMTPERVMFHAIRVPWSSR